MESTVHVRTDLKVNQCLARYHLNIEPRKIFFLRMKMTRIDFCALILNQDHNFQVANFFFQFRSIICTLDIFKSTHPNLHLVQINCQIGKKTVCKNGPPLISSSHALTWVDSVWFKLCRLILMIKVKTTMSRSTLSSIVCQLSNSFFFFSLNLPYIDCFHLKLSNTRSF